MSGNDAPHDSAPQKRAQEQAHADEGAATAAQVEAAPQGGIPFPTGLAQARVIHKLGLLLPGVVRVLELRRSQHTPRRWAVTLTDAPFPLDSEGAALSEHEEVVRGHSLHAFITFETDDLALVQQLRPRGLRLAVDLLELQRSAPDVGLLDLP